MASKVPVQIPNRPYAICPPTNMMNPDGFFVVNMGNQFIEAQVVNQSSAALQHVHAYVESKFGQYNFWPNHIIAPPQIALNDDSTQQVLCAEILPKTS